LAAAWRQREEQQEGQLQKNGQYACPKGHAHCHPITKPILEKEGNKKRKALGRADNMTT